MIRMSDKDLKKIKKTSLSALNKKVSKDVKGRLKKTDEKIEYTKIEILLAPRPKERARTFIDLKLIAKAFLSSENNIKKFMSNINHVMKTMTPDSTRTYENYINLYCLRHMKDNHLKLFNSPVELNIQFVYQGNPLEYPTSQSDGDLDNLEKALLDGMNKAVYTDDKLVVKKTSIKRCDAIPKIIVEIKTYSED